ncbi:hypothetical protein FOZ63_027387, partial [Perkinsus olseni]
GHYIPPLAAKLTGRTSSVRLEGILLGNPDVAPEIQWRFYPEMARANRLVYEYKYERLKDNADECMGLVRQCNREEVVVNKRPGIASRLWGFLGLRGTPCTRAWRVCMNGLITPIVDEGISVRHVDREDRSGTASPAFRNVANFLRKRSVQKVLGVTTSWTLTNMEVLNKLEEDRPRNYHHYLPNLIDHGLRVQIMVGDRDYLCNWMGNEAWTMELNWRGAHEFRKAEVVGYHDAYSIGELRSYTLPDTGGQLTFIRVYGAGHDVAKDVPRAALKMVDEFLNNKLR